MEQLGPVSPPITGPTPATVPGQTQLSEANTAMRDDGLPGGRGLVRSQPCSPITHPVAYTAVRDDGLPGGHSLTWLPALHS